MGFVSGLTTALGIVPAKMLTAISCGAVFMGAITYIGNAPNFMVKSISDENGVKMLLWVYCVVIVSPLYQYSLLTHYYSLYN